MNILSGFNLHITTWRWQSTAETCRRKYCTIIYTFVWKCFVL